MPVGGGKQIGVEEMQQSAVRVGATHKRTDQVAEIPIKVRKSNVRSSELEEQLPAAQGYDFEKMIQHQAREASAGYDGMMVSPFVNTDRKKVLM